MGRSQETYNKKEVRDKKAKRKKEKEEKRKARKEAGSRGEEDMVAYVDEFGNLTSTPPDPTAKKSTVKAEDIIIGVPSRIEDENMSNEHTGVVTFFNEEKGYGFIKDANSKQSIFVHINNFDGDELKENNKVIFEVEENAKGLSAVNVKLA